MSYTFVFRGQPYTWYQDLRKFFGFRVVAVLDYKQPTKKKEGVGWWRWIWCRGLTRSMIWRRDLNVSSILAAIIFCFFTFFRASGIKAFWWASGGNIILILHLVGVSRVPNEIILVGSGTPGGIRSWCDHVRELVMVCFPAFSYGEVSQKFIRSTKRRTLMFFSVSYFVTADKLKLHRYLSRMKNQHGRWVCNIDAGGPSVERRDYSS